MKQSYHRRHLNRKKYFAYSFCAIYYAKVKDMVALSRQDVPVDEAPVVTQNGFHQLIHDSGQIIALQNMLPTLSAR